MRVRLLVEKPWSDQTWNFLWLLHEMRRRALRDRFSRIYIPSRQYFFSVLSSHGLNDGERKAKKERERENYTATGLYLMATRCRRALVLRRSRMNFQGDRRKYQRQSTTLASSWAKGISVSYTRAFISLIALSFFLQFSRHGMRAFWEMFENRFYNALVRMKIHFIEK